MQRHGTRLLYCLITSTLNVLLLRTFLSGVTFVSWTKCIGTGKKKAVTYMSIKRYLPNYMYLFIHYLVSLHEDGSLITGWNAVL